MRKLQRLFDEADFTATYKYALLISLADLAVEDGRNGEGLSLPIRRIAGKFAEYYWPQSAPYASGRLGTQVDVLYQILGAQAAVVNSLGALRDGGSRTLRQARADPGWNRLIGKIARVVHDMPVVHLQNIGSDNDPFLYDVPSAGEPLVLKATVVHNLREFHAIIHRMARTGWLEHVRNNRRNDPIIGDRDDLEGFMFGATRRDLSKVAEVLKHDQRGVCFYCQHPIRGEGDVDHFIAWSRYPRDTAHNHQRSVNRQGAAA